MAYTWFNFSSSNLLQRVNFHFVSCPISMVCFEAWGIGYCHTCLYETRMPLFLKTGFCIWRTGTTDNINMFSVVGITLCYGPTLPTPRCCWCLEFQWKCQKLSAKTCKISHETLYFLKVTFSPNIILWNMFACMIRRLSLMHQSQGHVHCEKY
jgi:hypothetical protein